MASDCRTKDSRSHAGLAIYIRVEHQACTPADTYVQTRIAPVCECLRPGTSISPSAGHPATQPATSNSQTHPRDSLPHPGASWAAFVDPGSAARMAPAGMRTPLHWRQRLRRQAARLCAPSGDSLWRTPGMGAEHSDSALCWGPRRMLPVPCPCRTTSYFRCMCG